MSWSVKLADWNYILPTATQWTAQYYDPGRGTFIDGGWAWMDDPINFSPVTPNPGYLVVILYDGTTMTPWLYSSTFLPSDGDNWLYIIYLHGQAGDLELLNPHAAWVQIAERSGSIRMKAVIPAAWTQLSERSGSIRMKAVIPAAWTQLSERSGSIRMKAVTPAAWTQLAERSGSIRMKAVIPAAWTQLAERSGIINKGEVTTTGWHQIGQSVSANIKPGFLIPPDFKLVQENIYPDGKTYSGPAQRCTASWSFLPSSFPGASWFTEHMFINHLADKVTDQGEKILDMKLYEKGTDYILVMEITNTAKSYVKAFPFAIVIGGALLLAIIIVLTVLILKTEDFFYKNPLAAAGFSVLILGVAAAAVLGIALVKGASGSKEKKKVTAPAR